MHVFAGVPSSLLCLEDALFVMCAIAFGLYARSAHARRQIDFLVSLTEDGNGVSLSDKVLLLDSGRNIRFVFTSNSTCLVLYADTNGAERVECAVAEARDNSCHVTHFL